MITNIIQHYTTIHCVSIIRNRFQLYWASLDECTRKTILKILNTQQIRHGVQKDHEMQNNIIQKYLYQWNLL